MATGTIKRLVPDRGFGFIQQDDTSDGDLFFHRSAVTNATFEELSAGVRVTFDIGRSPKGPRAEDVRVGN